MSVLVIGASALHENSNVKYVEVDDPPLDDKVELELELIMVGLCRRLAGTYITMVPPFNEVTDIIHVTNVTENIAGRHSGCNASAEGNFTGSDIWSVNLHFQCLSRECIEVSVNPGNPDYPRQPTNGTIEDNGDLLWSGGQRSIRVGPDDPQPWIETPEVSTRMWQNMRCESTPAQNMTPCDVYCRGCGAQCLCVLEGLIPSGEHRLVTTHFMEGCRSTTELPSSLPGNESDPRNNPHAFPPAHCCIGWSEVTTCPNSAAPRYIGFVSLIIFMMLQI